MGHIRTPITTRHPWPSLQLKIIQEMQKIEKNAEKESLPPFYAFITSHTHTHINTLLSTLWIIYDKLMSQEKSYVCLFFILCFFSAFFSLLSQLDFSFPPLSLSPSFVAPFPRVSMQEKWIKNQKIRKFHHHHHENYYQWPMYSRTILCVVL